MVDEPELTISNKKPMTKIVGIFLCCLCIIGCIVYFSYHKGASDTCENSNGKLIEGYKCVDLNVTSVCQWENELHRVPECRGFA